MLPRLLNWPRPNRLAAVGRTRARARATVTATSSPDTDHVARLLAIIKIEQSRQSQMSERRHRPPHRRLRPVTANAEASGSSTVPQEHLRETSTSNIYGHVPSVLSVSAPSRRMRPAYPEPIGRSSMIPQHMRRPHAELNRDPAWTPMVRKGERIRVDTNSRSVLETRENVKNRVQDAVQRIFGSKYHIEFFGSTRYGVSYSDSDLDMVVIDPDHPHGYAMTEFQDLIYSPRKLAACMRGAGFGEVEYRARSSVPIVKFRDRVSGLECDLNVNERIGIINSDMIKQYCTCFPPLRAMLFAVKEWAKPLGMNSPSGTKSVPTSFSSYALALMTIGFLQSEGLLPNLQANLPPLPPDGSFEIWTRKPHKSWDVRFHISDFSPYLPTSNIDLLLGKWFHFWTTCDYSQNCISIRNGGVVNRNDPEVREAASSGNPISPICVVDPFIRTKNCALAITPTVLDRFRNECARAAVAHRSGDNHMRQPFQAHLT